MTLRSCDGALFRRAMTAATATLDRHVAEVDSLNVYPVPDGDTGRNMLVTMRAALEQADAAEPGDGSIGRIAGAMAHGALMGARGNSGVILSQVLRGVAEGLDGLHRADARTLAGALRCGSRAADAAVPEPVEGTILTVVRAAADRAVGAAEVDRTLAGILTAAIEAAGTAVLRTPEQLPILAQAGVVDAGGRGFELLLRGALLGVGEGGAHHPSGGSLGPGLSPAAPVHATDAGWGYETMFLVTAHPGTRLDLDVMRTQLAELGASVLVVGDGRMARVHLHSDRPDLALGYGLRRGTLSRVTVENLDVLSAGEREERAAELLVGSRSGPSRPSPVAATSAAPRTATIPFAIVAVAPGAGFARTFEALGARPLLTSGPARTASTGDLLEAIVATRAASVVVLPNDRNTRLAAHQAATLAEGVDVHVVPTRNAAEGLAAVLAVDPRTSPAEAADRMRGAALRVRSVSITHAVRVARLGGRQVVPGDAIALDADDVLVAAGTDRFTVALDAVRAVAGTPELITIHHAIGVEPDEMSRFAALLAGELPGVTVEVVDGGQSLPAYLIAAE